MIDQLNTNGSERFINVKKTLFTQSGEQASCYQASLIDKLGFVIVK